MVGVVCDKGGGKQQRRNILYTITSEGKSVAKNHACLLREEQECSLGQMTLCLGKSPDRFDYKRGTFQDRIWCLKYGFLTFNINYFLCCTVI